MATEEKDTVDFRPISNKEEESTMAQPQEWQISEETIESGKTISRHDANDEGDVTLVIEDENVVVSKAVLCIASPVFKAMFRSDFKEKSCDSIPLPGKKLDDFNMFLDCIYPDKLVPVSRCNVYQVVPLVHEYQVSALVDKCENVLLEVVQTFEDTVLNDGKELFKHFTLADKYELNKLKSLCSNLASEMCESTRQESMKDFPVDAYTNVTILTMAVKRLELQRSDGQYMLTGVLGKNETLQTIQGKHSSGSFQPKTTAVSCGVFGTPVTTASCFGFGTSLPAATSGYAIQSTTASSRLLGIQTTAGASSGLFGTPGNVTEPSQNMSGAKVLISSKISMEVSDSTQLQAFKCHLQGLRLVYEHFPNDTGFKSMALKQVRSDMKRSDFKASVGSEYELLPERVKHDIRGRYVKRF